MTYAKTHDLEHRTWHNRWLLIGEALNSKSNSWHEINANSVLNT